jgi:hypothetical protein
MYSAGEDQLSPLYGFKVSSRQLRRFCDRVQALPSPLLPVVLDGLFRSAPAGLPRVLQDDSVRSAFADHVDDGRVSISLRCTWRARRILEEYRFGCGPFARYPVDTTRWLAGDRLIEGRGREFWSLRRCLRVVGARPWHRCASLER